MQHSGITRGRDSDNKLHQRCIIEERGCISNNNKFVIFHLSIMETVDRIHKACINTPFVSVTIKFLDIFLIRRDRIRILGNK